MTVPIARCWRATISNSSFITNQEDFDRAKAGIVAAGFPIAIEGNDPVAQYFYADLRPVLGHHIEYVLYDAEAGPALLAAIPVN